MAKRLIHPSERPSKYDMQQYEEHLAGIWADAQSVMQEIDLYYNRLYPIWDHPFWRSPFGEMSANLYGFDMPADLSAQIPHQNLTAQRKHGKLRRLRRELEQESTTERVMRQMGDFTPR